MVRSRTPTLFTITLSVWLNAVLHCSHRWTLLGQSLLSSLLTNWYCLPLILSGSKKSMAGFAFDEFFVTYKKIEFSQLSYSRKEPIAFGDKGLFHLTRDFHNAGLVLACERRRISGCHWFNRQPEIRLRSQASLVGIHFILCCNIKEK